MPHKFNEPRRHRIPRARHRVQNWPECDRALQRRGSLTVWVTPEALAALVHGSAIELKRTFECFQLFTDSVDEPQLIRVRNSTANCAHYVTTCADLSPERVFDKV